MNAFCKTQFFNQITPSPKHRTEPSPRVHETTDTVRQAFQKRSFRSALRKQAKNLFNLSGKIHSLRP